MQSIDTAQQEVEQLKKLNDLVALLNVMIKVNDEITAQNIAESINSHIGKVQLRINFRLVPHFNTDMAAATFIFLTEIIMDRTAKSEPYIKISYKNGEKHLYRSPSSVVTSLLMDLLTNLNYPMEMCFLEPLKKVYRELWKKQTVNQIYTPRIRSFYSVVYQKMGQYLASYIKQNASPIKNVLLISAACGNAKDLNAIAQYLSDVQTSYAGFDINSNNIRLAKKLIANGHFLQGDIAGIDKHLVDIKQNYKKRHANQSSYLSVIIFSGILQRQMLNGSAEALRYLQIAFREAQFTMVSSLQFPLITRNIAKAIGFTVNMQKIQNITANESDTNVLFCLEPQNDKDRLESIIKRSNKRSLDQKPTNIDLSLSANPLADLLLIDQNVSQRFSETIQLDLSWSYITERELIEIVKIMREKMIKLERVIIANVESWANSLLNMHLPYAIFKRNDVLNENEIPEFSVPSARFFKLYKTLPTTMIQDKPEIKDDLVVQKSIQNK